MTEEQEPDAIHARFTATSRKATIMCLYKAISLTIEWPMKGDQAEAAADLQTLLANLPEVATNGLTEIAVASEMSQVDTEYRDLLKDNE